jgi:hypothetical protein
MKLYVSISIINQRFLSLMRGIRESHIINFRSSLSRIVKVMSYIKVSSSTSLRRNFNACRVVALFRNVQHCRITSVPGTSSSQFPELSPYPCRLFFTNCVAIARRANFASQLRATANFSSKLRVTAVH